MYPEAAAGNLHSFILMRKLGSMSSPYHGLPSILPTSSPDYILNPHHNSGYRGLKLLWHIGMLQGVRF